MNKITYLAICFSFLFALMGYSDEVRTWTSAGGQHKIEAEFVKISDDGKSITLRQKDGTEYAVELDKLSKVDQTYVAKQKATANQPEQKAATPPVQSSPVRPAPRPYTVRELEDHVFNVMRSIHMTRSSQVGLLNDNRRSIAIYLYYVQMAYEARLTNAQIDARLRLLIDDVERSPSRWLGQKSVDHVFQRIDLKLGSGTTPESKRVNDIEQKARALSKDKGTLRGM